jgi:GNAT superfamily N-acetyltransferase
MLKDRTITIRRATVADREALRAMQAFSISVLGGAWYSPEQIAAFICHVGTLDDFLLHEGTYYVAESATGEIVASGGWSRQRPNYANVLAEPSTSAPKVRGVFVHPAFARRGIASTLIARAESEAVAAGCREMDLTATLSGVPLYVKRGYRTQKKVELILPGGIGFPVVMMRKDLSDARDALSRPVARAS